MNTGFACSAFIVQAVGSVPFWSLIRLLKVSKQITSLCLITLFQL